MKKHCRTFSGIFLLVLLCALCLCTGVSAASGAVAKIGNKRYASLEKAVENVKNGQTIRLQRNVDIPGEPVRLKSRARYTIDLNGYTVTQEKNRLIFDGGTITLKNGTMKCSVYVLKKTFLKIASGTYNYVSVNSYGRLRITGGTFNMKTNIEGTASIWGGTFNCIFVDGEYGNATKLTIHDATVISESVCVDIYGGGSTVNIRGGTYISPTGLVLDISSYNTVKISGGTFCTRSDCYPVIRNYGELTVTGGKISSVKNAVMSSGELEIRGGSVRSQKKHAIYCYGQIRRFRLSGGKVSSCSKKYPAVALGGKKSRKISIKKDCITSPYRKVAYRVAA